MLTLGIILICVPIVALFLLVIYADGWDGFLAFLLTSLITIIMAGFFVAGVALIGLNLAG